jgi:outer membrane protein assembly factor BamD (BamD/ComL family)
MINMKKSIAYILVFLLIGIAFSCGNNSEQEATNIETPEQKLAFITELEQKLKENKETVDLVTANALVNNYIKFENEFPTHEKAPYCLFEAAKLCMGIERPLEAVEYFGKFVTNFSENERVPLALFLQGFIYENNLADMPNAKLKYEEFLEKYPQHEMAKDAQIALQNLGKTPEELIKEFEAKNKENI